MWRGQFNWICANSCKLNWIYMLHFFSKIKGRAYLFGDSARFFCLWNRLNVSFHARRTFEKSCPIYVSRTYEFEGQTAQFFFLEMSGACWLFPNRLWRSCPFILLKKCNMRRSSDTGLICFLVFLSVSPPLLLYFSLWFSKLDDLFKLYHIHT